MLDSSRVASIIERLRRDEPQALDDFLTSVAPTLQRYGLRMCGNEEDAQDIAQESLIAAMKNIGGFRGESSVSTWLYTIARSFCIKKRRRSKYAPRTIEPLHSLAAEALGYEAVALDEMHKAQFQKALDGVLATLEDSQREVFLLRDMEGLSAREVADTLGISESAVKSRLHRAREKVRQGMEPWFRRTREEPQGAPCVQKSEIGAAFSQFLEGELDPAFCDRLKQHVEGCPHCRSACDCLKATLDLCRNEGEGAAILTPRRLTELRESLKACQKGL